MSRNDTTSSKTRIAIVNPNKCRPKKCGLECKTECPVNKVGKRCIAVKKKDKVATISETLCTGCNICTKKCPFGAIQIINLPEHLNDNQTAHRYPGNAFKLYRLPTPRQGQVLGLVGTNGIGKSTALRILGGNMMPNLGNSLNPPDWNEIIAYFRGSELQNYFSGLAKKELKSLFKPQYVDALQKRYKGDIGAKEASMKYMLDKKSERGEKVFNDMINTLELRSLYNEGRDIRHLSGGEMQRYCIALICIQKADVYIFDEPSSFLDVKQRLNAAYCIRGLVNGVDEGGGKGGERSDGSKRYVICVEHDLAVLDYLSDHVCCLYGQPGGYGVVTMPYSVREGINIFLGGYLPKENMRFRNTELTFKMSTRAHESAIEYKELDSFDPKANAKEEDGLVSIHPRGVVTRGNKKQKHAVDYPSMTKTLGNFTLHIESGSYARSEIIVLLGQNGTGKTTMIKMLSGMKGYEPDQNSEDGGDSFTMAKSHVSYKSQTLDPKFEGNVQELLYKKIKDSYLNQQYRADVFKPLRIEELLDMKVKELSGGELQRVAIAMCLGKTAQIYLIDEPSSYLDCEERINVAKVIKRFVLHQRKTAFIVEHDFIMATYLADRVIYYDGEPSKECTAHTPQDLLSGMNAFLKQLDITFRRDPTNWRPRINKWGSNKDSEQKASGNYFFLND
jgi:ATP-binding cassette subfamily E protein 1